MGKKKINYDSNLIIRISKKEREAISKWAKDNNTSVSELTRQHYIRLVGGQQ